MLLVADAFWPLWGTPPRTPTFSYGRTALRWCVGDLAPSNWAAGVNSLKWSIGGIQMDAEVPISALSLEYIRVPVMATVNGQAANPTTDVVKMAFLQGLSTQPSVGDWKTASWDTGNGTGQYFAQCLVGPAGAVTLTAGTWYVWIQISDNPEIPVRQVGVLQVV